MPDPLGVVTAPIVDVPVTSGSVSLTLRHITELVPASLRDRGEVKALLFQMFTDTLPPEIHCAAPTLIPRSEEIAANLGPDSFRRVRDNEEDRVSAAAHAGHVRPIWFAAFDDRDDLVGAFEWYALRMLSSGGLEAMPFPAYHKIGREPEQIDICWATVDVFLRGVPIEINDAPSVIEQIRTFTFDDIGGRTFRGDALTQAWDAEVLRRATDPDETVDAEGDANEWGQREIFLTRRGFPPPERPPTRPDRTAIDLQRRPGG